MNVPDLKSFDLIVVNSSGGKDSQTALRKVALLATWQGFESKRVIVSHQDLGASEWPGTYDLVCQQARHYGFKVIVSRYRNKDGKERSLLDYVERRGKWPSSKQRFCTSDFKRGPGERVIRGLTCLKGRTYRVLNVLGFRAEESPARAKRIPWGVNKRLRTHAREVIDWLPIHDWSEEQVWNDIKASGVPYHPAYDHGMPRLSCVFCIFANRNALLLAGAHNPGLLSRYVEVEKRIGHTFKKDLSLADVKRDLESGVKPEAVASWAM